MTPSAHAGGPRLLRLQRWTEARQLSLVLVLALVVLAGIVQGLNLGGAPRYTALEGANTAQAWAFLNLDVPGTLADSSLRYAWPAAGWLQLAGWTGLSGAFQRYDGALEATREAMLVAHLVAIVLLWLLARRLGFARGFAAAALAIFALSPLAVQAHRLVVFANLATPWLLAAWLLALAPRRQAFTFAGASACFAMAAFSEPGYLVFLPFLAWSMWRTATPGSRALRLSLAAAVLAVLGVGYGLVTLSFGPEFPSSGSGLSVNAVFEQMSLAGQALTSASLEETGLPAALLGQDPVLVLIGSVGALGGLFRPVLRPLSAAFILWVVLLFTPLGLSASSAFAMVAVAALLAAGAAELAWSKARDDEEAQWSTRSVAVAVVFGLVALAALPLWGSRLDGLMREDQNRPLAQARGWAVDNLARDSRLILGPQLWVDMLSAGFATENVANAGPAVLLAGDLEPRSNWRDYDYVITGETAELSPIAASAAGSSEVLASFGAEDLAVSVRRVLPEGVAVGQKSERADVAERQAAGAELVRNPSLRLSQPVRDLVAEGQLDPRALVLLPLAATTGTLRIEALPAVDGEAGNGRPRRQVLISGRDGAFLSTEESEALSKTFLEQSAKYRPVSVTPRAGSLLITWGLDYPTGLFG